MKRGGGAVLLLLLAATAGWRGGAAEGECGVSNIVVYQRRLMFGLVMSRWRLVVSNTCGTCAAEMIVLNCPYWYETRQREAQGNIVLVGPGVCLLGPDGQLFPGQSFSADYLQRSRINFSPLSVRFAC